jgi:hypothetical protein
MVKIVRIIVGTAFCFLLISCADQIENISNDYKFNMKSGVILLSLTASGECGYSYFTEIREIISKKSYSIGMQDFGRQRDWIKSNAECPSKIDNYFGKLVAIELPIGNYEIYQFEGISTYSKIFAKNNMSVKFTVEPNKVNYLGNMHYHMKKKIFFYNVNNLNQRDISLFRKKYKKFNMQDIIINLLKINNAKTLAT